MALLVQLAVVYAKYKMSRQGAQTETFTHYHLKNPVGVQNEMTL